MQVVIDIPEEIYDYIHSEYMSIRCRDAHKIAEAIFYGTPLPKGCGDLIERDKIEFLKAIHDAKYGHISWSDAIKKIKYSAPTIIEADKESEGI